jgi:hypothetical protein
MTEDDISARCLDSLFADSLVAHARPHHRIAAPPGYWLREEWDTRVVVSTASAGLEGNGASFAVCVRLKRSSYSTWVVDGEGWACVLTEPAPGGLDGAVVVCKDARFVGGCVVMAGQSCAVLLEGSGEVSTRYTCTRGRVVKSVGSVSTTDTGDDVIDLVGWIGVKGALHDQTSLALLLWDIEDFGTTNKKQQKQRPVEEEEDEDEELSDWDVYDALCGYEIDMQAHANVNAIRQCVVKVDDMLGYWSPLCMPGENYISFGDCAVCIIKPL